MRLNVPLTGARELRAVRKVIFSGFLTQGPKSSEFEDLIADYVGVESAFAVSSATTGLHLALVALGVGPGDEVIVPDFSFPATANVVEQIGAVPRLVDIDPRTFNLDPAKLEDAISPKSKVIMPVHAFGRVADMDAINAIAARYGLPVVEDAACALSANLGGKQAGSLGTVGVFSFHPRKIITTAEGGMITTDDPALAEKIRVLRSHGGVRGELYMSFLEAGFNYRLSDVHAAIGIAQMAKLEKIVRVRQSLARKFEVLLSEIEEIEIPTIPQNSRHAFQSYVIKLSVKIDRDQVIREMRSQGIETTLGTYALHLQPYFRAKYNLLDSHFPHATAAHYRALTLPIFTQLTSRGVSRIVRSLRSAITRSRVSLSL